MHIAIVFNPGSGPRAAANALRSVVVALASHNHVLEVIDCEWQADFERELCQKAPEFDRVIVIGGDGTLNGVINAIATSRHTNLPVAFVPTGRGKDTARSLASWQASDLADGAFEHGRIVPIDLIHITLANGVTRYGINISSIGLAAHAAGVANALPRIMGSLSYVAGAVRGMIPRNPFRIKMQLDGQEHTIDNALLIAACNGKAFGGGIYIAPEASQGDNLLDIVVAHNANLGDLALQLGKLKSGKPFDHPALSRWKTPRVELEPIDNVHSEADGELLSAPPTSFEIAPGILNWVTP